MVANESLLEYSGRVEGFLGRYYMTIFRDQELV